MRQLVLLDTGPLVSYVMRSDGHNAWAAEQFREHTAPMLTCEAVLAEACHIVRHVHGCREDLLEMLERGIFRIDFSLQDELEALRRLMNKYDDVSMSLADACLVRMAEKIDDGAVMTLDRHFQVYRKSDRHIIPVIMPPKEKP